MGNTTKPLYPLLRIQVETSSVVKKRNSTCPRGAEPGDDARPAHEDGCRTVADQAVVHDGENRLFFNRRIVSKATGVLKVS
jgi:hypothetical protein